jgi:hypothetical protein
MKNSHRPFYLAFDAKIIKTFLSQLSFYGNSCLLMIKKYLKESGFLQAFKMITLELMAQGLLVQRNKKQLQHKSTWNN